MKISLFLFFNGTTTKINEYINLGKKNIRAR